MIKLIRNKKFLFLFCGLLLTFLFLAKTSFPILASCIPSNQDTTGCTLISTVDGNCVGGYEEDVPGPTPTNCPVETSMYKKVYFCNCQCVYQNWGSCPGSRLSPVVTYSFVNSSLSTMTDCFPKIRRYPLVSREIATNQTACDNWCRPIIPTPTPTRTCTGQYYQKPQCAYRYVGRTDGVCDLNEKLGAINRNNLNDPINTWKWSWCSKSMMAPTPTPTARPTTVPSLNCQGQYFGESQCKARTAKLTGGSCQLNPALGSINTSNLSDPINYWKWSYCTKI